MTRQTKFYPLQGGLNLVTPAIRMPPGHLIAGVNYEPVEKGYQRFGGFERYDGRPAPSDASYWVLDFDAGEAAMSEGDIITDGGTGATGEALIDAVVESGAYATNDAAGYLVLVNVVGTFVDDNDLEVSAVKKSVADGTTTSRGADNDTNDTTWLRDAIETTRDDIQVVAGSGVIRGVWIYNGIRYAIRDNAGVTAGVLFKSTTAGWVAQTLGFSLSFTSGSVEIVEADTIEGESSGATGTVGRVILTSGTWAGTDAAGRLILTAQTGTFQAETLKVGVSLNQASIAGNSTANALSAGGRYEFVNYNFTGASNRYRMYGAGGVDTAFEWDGTVFVPIITTMPTDTPDHIGVYKNQLFLDFDGGSSQQSALGDPYSWTPITGASEIAMGQEITGYLRDIGKSMLIFCRNKVGQLYGNDSSDFVLETLSEEAGAVEWTIQMIGVGIYMDDRGIRDVRTTRAFGDFKMGTLTQIVEPLFRANKKTGVTAVASLRCREKDQYRLFWSDGTGLTVYLGRKMPEAIPFDYGKVVSCVSSGEDSDGNEIMLFGSSDGYVYQIDAGTSYDGDSVTAYLRLPFNHVGTPTRKKQWFKAVLEIDTQPSSQIGVLADFSYAAEDLTSTVQQNFTVSGGGAFWDEVNWDEFYWTAAVEGLAEAYIEGIGTNVSLAIISDATYEDPHTIHGLTLHYSDRGLER